MIYGLILVGGKSSRMGSDKSQINFHGKPQSEFLFELLNQYCTKVFFSCREEQNFSLEPNIIDKYSEVGPIGGILSAFEENSDVAWLVVACDMPYVDWASLDILIKNRNPNKLATAFINSVNQSPEPLITIYEKHSYRFLKTFFEEGSQSLKFFLKGIDIQQIVIENHILSNINSPTDLDAYVNNSANK